MTSAKNETGAKVLAAFEVMISGIPGVVQKGAAIPYVAINGNMYASISRADVIGLRLSRDDRDEFLDTYHHGLFEAFPGHYQREYVAVPSSMYADPEALRLWFRRSYAYASALKPKATKRSR